jgi:hypothetical protein
MRFISNGVFAKKIASGEELVDRWGVEGPSTVLVVSGEGK